MQTGHFNDLPTTVLENDFVKLETLQNSARIVRLALQGKESLLANLGEKNVNTRYGDFFFRGGHRFWHSPEAMPRTYIPDDNGAITTLIPGGIRIEQPAEQWSQMVKSIEITLNPDRPQVLIKHELKNEGAWEVELAPWALTMLRLGGIGVFPQATEQEDEAGLLPNRQLTIWPYTNISDPRLVLRNDFILVRATPSLPPIKIGYFNPHGWQAYWIDKVLFVKKFDLVHNVPYPDGGCNTETYCNDQFIELESLGPLQKLSPGDTLYHHETWELYTNVDQPFLPHEIQTILQNSN